MEVLTQLKKNGTNNEAIANTNFNTLLQMIKNIESKMSTIIVENINKDSIVVNAKGFKRIIKTEV